MGALGPACENGRLDAVKFLVDVVHLAVNDTHVVEKLVLEICCCTDISVFN